MRQFIDLTGQRFERLTVLELAVRGKHTSWKVRCDCGVIKQAMTENLTSGRIKSCGCLRKTLGATKRIDLVGQKFTRLLVIKPIEDNKHGQSVFECVCDCGTVTNVSSNSLRRGTIRSCGCLKIEVLNRRRTDLTGRRFGLLLVIGYIGGKGTKYSAVCDCGKAILVRAGSLVNGDTISCGCSKINRLFTHGHTANGHRTRTYVSWMSIKARCLRKNHKSYARYGGRQPNPIMVCDRWLGEHGYEHFLADMGERGEGMSIHRVNDALVYCKENCVWADKFRQSREKSGVLLNIAKARDIRKHHAEGVATKELAEIFGISRSGISCVVSGRTWKEQAAA